MSYAQAAQGNINNSKTHSGHSENSVPTPQNTDNFTRLENLTEKQTEQINNLLSTTHTLHGQTNTHRSKIKPMRIALWNANGVTQQKFELELFLKQQQIDVMLISETHFTDKNYLKIHGYNFYHTSHPNGKAHGGTGIIIKSSIKHYELPSFQKDYLQAPNIAIEGCHGTITTSAVYCPPRHSIAKGDFVYFLDALGNRFIAGGVYRTKHIQWGSRFIRVRGKNLLNSIITNNLNYLATYEPTYWPTDTNKIPDLLDFFITKSISPRYVQINSSAELSSEHSPVIATVSSTIIENPPNGFIHNQLTNWQLFREVFNRSTSALISLKTNEDIETVTEYLNTSIINAIPLLYTY